MITSWRIVTRRRAADAFSGEGAARFPGRWNIRGTRVIYTAQSAALAALEMLVHLDHESDLQSYVLFACTFREELVEAIDRTQLPRRWKDSPPPAELSHLGHAWLLARRAAVLQVPSGIVPAESNYLFNPEHPDFAATAIAEPIPFSLDTRLLRGS